MKVIDLLNKIANGEEVPKWVVYDKKEYTYMEECKDYVHEVYNNGTMLFLLSKIFTKNGIDIVLNQELDFIEEDKKIEKIDKDDLVIGTPNGARVSFTLADSILLDKINEIIEAINGRKI